MRLDLRTSLALSYLVTLLLFCLALLIFFPLFLRLLGPYPHRAGLLPPPHEELRAHLEALLRRQSPDSPGFREELRHSPIFRGASVELIGPDRRDTLQGRPGAAPDPPPWCWRGEAADVFLANQTIVLYQPFPVEGPVRLVVTVHRLRPTGGQDRSNASLALLLSTGLAALLGLAVGLLFSRRLARPLRLVSEAVREFGPDTTVRLPTAGPPELARLSESFNGMANRLQDTLQRLRQERNRAVELESAQRQFLGDVSHNLGTPLAAVQGWLDMMVDGIVVDPAEREELLGKVRREVLHVSKTVRQLLELTRWRSLGPVLQVETLTLLEPLMEVVDNLAEAAAARNLQLTFEGLDARLQVRADRIRLRDMLQILLENCVEHAGENVAITVLASTEGDRVWVRVRDEGPGLPASVLQWLRLSDPEVAPGAGMGLAILRRLAQAHGGELRVESRPGWTEICFSLEAAV